MAYCCVPDVCAAPHWDLEEWEENRCVSVRVGRYPTQYMALSSRGKSPVWGALFLCASRGIIAILLSLFRKQCHEECLHTDSLLTMEDIFEDCHD